MAENLRHRCNDAAQSYINQRNSHDWTACEAAPDSGINIVLLGKTGVGKSSSGNTILGQNIFPCGRSLSAVTSASSIQKAVVDGRSVSVIDTPGFFCTNLSQEQLAWEFARSVFLAAPGVHVFLFVVPFGRFTEQEEDILNKVQKVYGKDVLKHVILLFTYGDECISEKMRAEIGGNEVVSRVVRSCQGYHVLDNKDLTNRRQVTDLLQKINGVVERNQGYYTNEMYKWAQMTTLEKFWIRFKDFFEAVIAFFLNQANSSQMRHMAPYMRL